MGGGGVAPEGEAGLNGLDEFGSLELSMGRLLDIVSV